jgi:nucleotide-binding universal stress UspA family protein
MSRILAMLDDSPLAPGVLRTATAFADLLDADVDAVTVLTDTGRPGQQRPSVLDVSPRILTGDPDVVLRDAVAAPDVLMGVLGTRTVLSHPQLLGHISRAIATGCTVPLVLVPPGCRTFSTDHPVFLLPLDGDHRTSASVAPITELLSAHGARLVALHVYDSTTVPMFAPSRHGDSALADDFLARHAPDAAHRVEVRLGKPAHHILDTARRHDVDGIVLAWSQDLGPGRAETIRRVVAEAALPVVLTPCR